MSRPSLAKARTTAVTARLTGATKALGEHAGRFAGLPRGTFIPAAAFVFLGMNASVALRTFADSMFLDVVGVSKLPFFMVASAGAFAAASWVYSALVGRVSTARLDAGLLLVCAVASLGAQVAHVSSPAAVFGWALVLSVVAPLANLAAWNWASMAVDARTAKRALPLLGAAATGGAVVFGALVPMLVQRLGLARMPLCAAATYVVMAFLPSLIERRGTVGGRDARAAAPTPPAAPGAPKAAAKTKEPAVAAPPRALLMALMLYALCESLASVVAEYQLKAAAETAGSRERIAVVLGVFQSVSSAGLLALQVTLVGRVLARFGVQVGLFVAPIGMLVAGLGIIAAPGRTFLAIGPRLADGLFKFSFGRSAMEIAMVPLGDRARRKAKILVRGVPGPLGNVIAGALLLALVNLHGGRASPVATSLYLGVPILIAWIFVARLVLRRYLVALRSGLAIRRVELVAQPFGVGTLERGAEVGLVSMLLSDKPEDAAFAAGMLGESLSDKQAERLLRHAEPRVRAVAWKALASPPGVRGKLPRELAVHEESPLVRAEAIVAFAERDDDRLADVAGRWAEATGGAEQTRVAFEARMYRARVGRLGREGLLATARDVLGTDGRRAGVLLRASVLREEVTADEAFALASGASVGQGGAEAATQSLRALVALATPEALHEVLRRADAEEGGPAARAVVDAPAAVMPLVADALVDAPAGVRERVARAMGTAAEAGQRLAGTLLGDRDAAVRAATARSLMRLARTVAGARPPTGGVEAALRLELAFGHALRRAKRMQSRRTDEAAVFAREEIELRLVRTSERLFLLLALVGEARTMQAALRRFHSGEEGSRRVVLTLIEDLPSTPLRAELVAFLEGREPDVEDSAALAHALAADPFIVRCIEDEPSLRALRPRILALRSTTLFRGIGADVLSRLASEAEAREVKEGEAIVKQGEAGDALFVMLEGSVRFDRDGRTVGHVGAGQAFGELSVIDGAPRGASAVVETPGRCLRLSRATVWSALEHHPDLWQGVARALARWIRETRPAVPVARADETDYSGVFVMGGGGARRS